MPYPEEPPTRPDHPQVARRCKLCGKVYGDHVQGIQPINGQGCGGLRKYFADPGPEPKHDR